MSEEENNETWDKILYDGNTTEKWVEELEKHRFWNRRHLFAVFAMMGTPRTLLDVGCGIGDLVHVARQLGVEAYGVDQLVDDTFDKGWYIHHNLEEPFNLRDTMDISLVDIVLCWEVAEHLNEDKFEALLDTCANHLIADEKSFLIWTSAHPGQGGTMHISNKPSYFWRDEFHLRGLHFEYDLSVRLALLWQSIESPLIWLPANVQVFSKKKR